MNTILKLRCCSDDEDDDIIVAMYKHESRTIKDEFGKKAVPFFIRTSTLVEGRANQGST